MFGTRGEKVVMLRSFSQVSVSLLTDIFITYVSGVVQSIVQIVLFSIDKSTNKEPDSFVSPNGSSSVAFLKSPQ